MDPAIIDYMMFAIIGLSVTTIGFAVAWLRARERAIRAELHGSAAAGWLPAQTESRFDRIDQAVEAVAIEVERVAESERFQSRLMAERVVTPLESQPASPIAG